MKKYIVELTGAFFLVLIALLTANNGTGALAPLAVGAGLTALIYAGQPRSGAHYNPAISLAMFLQRRINRTDFLYYVIAQLGGALFGALIAVFLLNCGPAPEIVPFAHNNAICSIVAEFLGTAAWAYVALNVTAPPTGADRAHHGLAIGFTVLAATLALGPVSGAAFNPALAAGYAVSGNFDAGDLWLYLVGPVLGAAAGSTVYQISTPPE